MRRLARVARVGRHADTDDRLLALADAIDLARDRQEPDRVRTSEEILTRSRERLTRGPDHVVVAFGGGTGSGKSSLSNAVAGRPLSAVAPVRPTTERALLWSVGDPDRDLVEWLQVTDRQVISPREDLPEGLVVLDLPDHDSVRSSHRATVDAAVKVVDIMVFVVDPLKYAQMSLFEGYLRPLAHHAKVVLVVLNRADELPADGERECVADLRRLLDESGLARARLLVTSAATGRGVDELRAVLAEEARSRRAVGDRVHADVVQAAGLLAADIDMTAQLGADEPVAEALAAAADLSGAVVTAAATYRERGLSGTRPPVSGLLVSHGKRITRPLRTPMAVRLRQTSRLGTDSSGGGGPAATGATSGNGRQAARTQDPAPVDSPSPGNGSGAEDQSGAGVPAPAGRRRDVALRHALRALTDPFAAGLPEEWQRRVRRLALEVGDRLPGQTRDALDVVALHPPQRFWWLVVGFLWTLVELAVIVGVGWLLSLFVIAWLQLPEPPTPELGALPWPTVLVLGGIPLWLLIRGLRSVAVRRGAGRHAARVHRRLRDQVEAATGVGLRPLGEEAAARDRLLDILGPLSRTH